MRQKWTKSLQGSKNPQTIDLKIDLFFLKGIS